ESEGLPASPSSSSHASTRSLPPPSSNAFEKAGARPSMKASTPASATARPHATRRFHMGTEDGTALGAVNSARSVASALAGLEAAILLVDDVDSAPAPHHAISAVAPD